MPFQGDRIASWPASLGPVLLLLSTPPASVSSTENPARRLRLSACRRVQFSRLLCKACSGDCASGGSTLLGSTTSWRKRRSFFSHTRSESGQLLATHHSYTEKKVVRLVESGRRKRLHRGTFSGSGSSQGDRVFTGGPRHIISTKLVTWPPPTPVPQADPLFPKPSPRPPNSSPSSPP